MNYHVRTQTAMIHSTNGHTVLTPATQALACKIVDSTGAGELEIEVEALDNQRFIVRDNDVFAD